MFVDERNGVLALERIDGWSIREVLGGGAEGEAEEDGGGEGEYVDPSTAEAIREEVEQVTSEGMEALERIGVSKGTCWFGPSAELRSRARDDCRQRQRGPVTD